jgi:DNA invertase Pin-like site-specific DNA recombinase
MSTVYGYFTGPDQRRIIQHFCSEHGLDLAGVFEDDANARDSDWVTRPAVRALMTALQPGDALVITGLAPLYSSRRALLPALRELQARDIALHFAGSAKSPSLAITGVLWNSFLQTLDVLFAFNTRVRGEAIREALYVKKLKGGRYTNYCGYGWRWQGPRGAQRRVADQSERATIRQIIELRDAGASWSQIALHLLRSGVRTTAGAEWSASRARRAWLIATRGRSRPDA